MSGERQLWAAVALLAINDARRRYIDNARAHAAGKEWCTYVDPAVNDGARAFAVVSPKSCLRRELAYFRSDDWHTVCALAGLDDMASPARIAALLRMSDADYLAATGWGTHAGGGRRANDVRAPRRRVVAARAR